MSNALLFVSKSVCCFNESKFSKLVLLHFERLTISFLALLIECLRVWYIRWCGGSLMSSKNDGNIGGWKRGHVVEETRNEGYTERKREGHRDRERRDRRERCWTQGKHFRRLPLLRCNVTRACGNPYFPQNP